MNYIDNIAAALVIAVLAFNLSQKHYSRRKGQKKRFATLLIAAPLVLFYAVTLAISFDRLPVSFLALPAMLCLPLFYFWRRNIFIFKTRCRACGKNLSLSRICYHDSNLCPVCEKKDRPEKTSIPRRVEDIDWQNRRFTETAVICYIVKNNKTLLIHKKTGLGAGKVNAPGGRLEAGESPEQAATRELQEEVGLTPLGLELRAELFFVFTNGHSIHGYAYFADDYQGKMVETEEAAPFWCSVDDLPWDAMWEDDRLWLPGLLAGEKITGWFIFEKDKMLSGKIQNLKQNPAAEE